MYHHPMRSLLTSLLFVSLATFTLVAQPPGGGKKGGGPPKNLKLLDPNSNIRETMQGFVKALGVSGCTFCHVQGDFASDEKPQKETARKMIEMVKQINSEFPIVDKHVSCYTCHHGAEEPANRPPAGEPPAHQ